MYEDSSQIQKIKIAKLSPNLTQLSWAEVSSDPNASNHPPMPTAKVVWKFHIKKTLPFILVYLMDSQANSWHIQNRSRIFLEGNSWQIQKE